MIENVAVNEKSGIICGISLKCIHQLVSSTISDLRHLIYFPSFVSLEQPNQHKNEFEKIHQRLEKTRSDIQENRLRLDRHEFMILAAESSIVQNQVNLQNFFSIYRDSFIRFHVETRTGAWHIDTGSQAAHILIFFSASAATTLV